MIIKIILLICCLILSAFFSGSEIVYAKVNRVKLERSANDGDKKSSRALKILNDYPKMISTILIGNNLVNIATSSVSTLLAIEIAAGLVSENVITSITTIIVTIVVLIFGEILPKTLCPNFSYTLSRKISGIVKIFLYIFYPITFVVTKFVDLLAKGWTKNNNKTVDDAEVDAELINMTDDLENNGKIDGDDAELIKSAIEFTDTTAWEIMVPRVDVIAYDIDDTLDKIITDQHFFENSRVVLYQGTIDHVIGLIDTTLVMKKKLTNQPILLNDILFEPLYVHKTMPISMILKEFKQNHKHLAIVLDEWGGVMGILTMEDILEELFGDIWDETDVIEQEYIEKSQNDYIVDGDMSIYDFFDLVEYDDRNFDSKYSTVGGWCTEILEKFPKAGDSFKFDNLEITILSVDGIRVDKVEVIIHNRIEEAV